jgi:hypothetical protein
MSDHEQHEPDGAADAAFAERLAAPLRAAERLDATFETRLLTAIEARRLVGRANRRRPIAQRRWWTRRRVVSVTPLAALGFAAGVLALASSVSMALGGLLLGRNTNVPASAATARATVHRDTIHLVRFVFVDSSAHSVSLVGDFNGWQKAATQLEPAGAPGAWAVSIPLSTGRHEYAFIVDGVRWATDPFAASREDDFGTESSVVTLRPGSSAS